MNCAVESLGNLIDKSCLNVLSIDSEVLQNAMEDASLQEAESEIKLMSKFPLL